MKIVIIGDGKVGHKLTTQLSEEDYDIVLIDQNEGKLKAALNSMDIFCISGNGADADVQRQADVQHADLVIACTSTDEMNMLICLLAKKIGAKHTIARVRNPMYYRQMDLLKDDLCLSMAVNPELEAANEIARVLLFPEANKVESFMKGKVELVEFPIENDSPLAGQSLAKINSRYDMKFLVCAVKRGDEVYIPDGDFVIQAGDKIHVVAPHQDLKTFIKALGRKDKKVKNVLISGAGHVCFYLTKQLQQAGMQVKVIEKRKDRCEEFSDMFPKATVIYGDAADQDLLLEEGIQEADAVVALTGIDEENIILSLFAKTQGVNKIIAKVNEERRAQMVESLGIDTTVSAKGATADVILAYVKARMNSYRSANIETMYRLVNGKIMAQEYIIQKESDYTNVPLKNMTTKPNNLIACIGRAGKIIIPNGDDHLEVGDSVIVIAKEHAVNNFRDILA